MPWVTCTLPTTSQQRAVNTDLVIHMTDRGSTTVLEFINGEKVTVSGGLKAFLAQIEQAIWRPFTAEDQRC